MYQVSWTTPLTYLCGTPTAGSLVETHTRFFNSKKSVTKFEQELLAAATILQLNLPTVSVKEITVSE